jgi:ribose-phosphate pyrophosphokinase
MRATLVAGSANPALAAAVAQRLKWQLGVVSLHRFPDGELHVAVRDSLRGHDVYVLQPTAPPVETHLLELLLLTDACRRAGAARVTAVIPYFGYARQDRRAGGREPVGARVIAELLQAAALERIVALDLHSPTLEGFFSIPLEHVTAVPALADAVAATLHDGRYIVVAPDLGAARLADRYGRALDLPVALTHKTRITGEEVEVRGITGNVTGYSPIIVDDMISTGGTVIAAMDALRRAGCRPVFTIVATHALLVGEAVARLGALRSAEVRVERVVVTDSVPARHTAAALPLETVTIAPLLADTITRLHDDRSLADLLVHC